MATRLLTLEQLSPPLERTGARCCSSSRFSTLMAAILLARAAVSYSVRHRVFPAAGCRGGTAAARSWPGGSALVVPLCSIAPLGVAGQLLGGTGRRERPLDRRLL